MKTKNIIKIVIGALLVLFGLQNILGVFAVSNIRQAAGLLFITLLVAGLGANLLYSGIKDHQDSAKQ